MTVRPIGGNYKECEEAIKYVNREFPFVPDNVFAQVDPRRTEVEGARKRFIELFGEGGRSSEISRWMKRYGKGRCTEMSYTAFDYLKKVSSRRICIVLVGPSYQRRTWGDYHVTVCVNATGVELERTIEVDQFSADTWFCDPWLAAWAKQQEDTSRHDHRGLYQPNQFAEVMSLSDYGTEGQIVFEKPAR